jgi:hypothetical protein
MLTFEGIIYFLCVLTSSLCAWLLMQAYRRQRQNLLMWSALAFCLLASNNLLVFVDLIVLPDIDLSPARSLTALAAGIVLLYGFIWEVE